jgi:hypothetical protein
LQRPSIRKTAAHNLGFVPAQGAENFELRGEKPVFAGLAVKRDQRFFALQTPGIWTRGVGVVTPEKADSGSCIDGHGDVLTDKPDALIAVRYAIYLWSLLSD